MQWGTWRWSGPGNTLEVLFTQRVQTLTDMGELRTTLGDLRRAEKDIIINFNNTIEVSNGRDLWKKSLQNLTKGMADVRKVQAADASFAEAIDKALAEVKAVRGRHFARVRADRARAD